MIADIDPERAGPKSRPYVGHDAAGRWPVRQGDRRPEGRFVSREGDRRFLVVRRKLAALRRSGRRAVRIVDADCGTGELLIRAVRAARSLGFLAIEARGTDRDPAMIERARAGASAIRDPAVGLTFDVAEPRRALEEEADFPADIVLYAPRHGDAALRHAATAAGDTVLGAVTPPRLAVA